MYENQFNDEAPTPRQSSGPEPPQEPKKRGGCMGWILGIAIAGLLISLFVNFVLFIAAFGEGKSSRFGSNYLSAGPEIVVAGDTASPHKILEIPIYGTIMDTEDPSSSKKSMQQLIQADLAAAEKDRSVKAVLLTINSPGGGITATDSIYNDIKKFKEKVQIPVVVYCKDMAASGGYYLAVSGDHIVAGETSLVGNIGVISNFVNFRKMFDKLGVEMNVITSKTWDGKQSYKDMGSFSREMRPEERELFQKMVQQMWQRFVTVVAEGRKEKLTEEEVKKLADGRIYTGTEAEQNKLIDSVGYREEAIGKAKELARIDSAKVVTYQRRNNIFQSFFESQAKNPAIIPDRDTLMQYRTPQFLYLWVAE